MGVGCFVITQSVYNHWLAPLCLLLILAFGCVALEWDAQVASAIYELGDDAWIFKKHWFFSGWIHEGGRLLVALLLIVTASTLVSTRWSEVTRRYRSALITLLLSVVCSLLIVSSLKALTHVDCPWSFSRYGGDAPYLSLVQQLMGSGDGRCFPSGHASGGYTWLALYFFFWQVKPAWRTLGLAIGLVLGLSFGVAQQLRGAHFLSHDVMTIAVCWYVPLAIHHLLGAGVIEGRSVTSIEPAAS